MKLHSAHRCKKQGEQGYIQIVLLLMVALLAIAMGSAVTNYKKSIQRDKEVEAIHRGVQYARAIKSYYRKFGRYPNSIDQLMNTNNLRFLRKKYSDPLSPDGKWRVLRQQDVKLLGTGGATGLAPSSGMPNIPGISGGGNTVLGGGGASNGGGGFNLFGGSSSQSDSNQGGAQGNSSQGTTSQGGPGSTSQPIGGAVETTGGKEQGNSDSAFGSGQPVLGGTPVVGVSSLRNETGIHSFNQKTNYRDWQFIFNPQTDMDRLITGPYNPNAVVGKGGQGLPASSLNQGTPQSTFGTSFTQQPQPQPAPSAPVPSQQPGAQQQQ
jgi:type II secretory pathway pseudopilin PulG